MIICHVITYSSVVFWPRGKLDSTERELTKLQRMVCIAMAGRIRTTPMTSLELLLGLFSLSMHIEAEDIMYKEI